MLSGSTSNPLSTMTKDPPRAVEIVGPPLHHFLALREVCCAVVAPPERVTDLVGELVFDQVWRKAELLVQERPRRGAPPVDRVRPVGDTDGAHRDRESVFTHRASVVPLPWKYPGLMAGMGMQRTENIDGLRRKRNDAIFVRFRNEVLPLWLGTIEVDVVPPRSAQFARSHKPERCQP